MNIIKNKNISLKRTSFLKAGFTLIETIIYIGIFSFIMAGALVSVYGILGSNTRNQTMAMAEQEGNFLLDKINWLISNKKTVSVNTLGTILTTTSKEDSTVVRIQIDELHKKLQVDSALGYEDLNNSNVQISCPSLPEQCFVHSNISIDGFDQESLLTSFILSTKGSDGISYTKKFSNITYIHP